MKALLFTLSICVLWAIMGYMIGLWVERKKWNKLIDEGIIPRPKKRKP